MVLNPDIRISYPETFIKMHESNSIRFVESNPLSSIYINIKTPGAKAPGVLMRLGSSIDTRCAEAQWLLCDDQVLLL